MQNLLSRTDRLLSKLGPVSQFIDTLAERLTPKANAQASCEHCYTYCGSTPCGRGGVYYGRYKHCYDQCYGDSWTTYLGCNC